MRVGDDVQITREPFASYDILDCIDLRTTDFYRVHNLQIGDVGKVVRIFASKVPVVEFPGKGQVEWWDPDSIEVVEEGEVRE